MFITLCFGTRDGGQGTETSLVTFLEFGWDSSFLWLATDMLKRTLFIKNNNR